MIHQSAYDTTACSAYVIDGIREAVLNGYLTGDIKALPHNENVLVVEGGHVIDQTVQQFNHPLVIEHAGKNLVAVDVRPTGKYDFQQQEFHVRDTNGHAFILMRGQLNELWVSGQESYLRNVSPMAMDVFASWLAEGIAKRIALEARDQALVTVLAAVFYSNLFSDKTELSDTDKVLMKSQIVKATGLPEVMVYDVIEQRSIITNLEDFCQACREVTQSVRFQNFNVSLLLQIVGGFWYGVNARELIAVALEHPPTWLAVMYQAITDRGMRNSGLTKILDRNRYKRNWPLFTRAILNLNNSVV